jgi:hypothetical protein
MKKLSKSQKEIVDLLEQNPTYVILESNYYNHQDIVCMNDNKWIRQFKLPTLTVLKKLDLIERIEGNKFRLKNK